MEYIPLINDISSIISLVMVVLVLPLLNQIKRSKAHDSRILQSIEVSTKNIEQLRIEMLESQRRHVRIEDAVLFLADDEKVKDVIAILRGLHPHSHDPESDHEA